MQNCFLDQIDNANKTIEALNDHIVELWDEFKKEQFDNLSFNEQFDLWYKYAPKKDYDWIEHIEPEGSLDFWELTDWYNRYETVSISTIIDILEDQCEGYKKITKEDLIEYKKVIMEKNIGSIVFDW